MQDDIASAPASSLEPLVADGFHSAMAIRSPVIFIGGIFTHEQSDQIEQDSIGVVQYAADALQKSLIKGLGTFYGVALRVVNLPFIGSYPRIYRKASFPAGRSSFEGVAVEGQWFINISVVRTASRYFSALRGLFAQNPSRNATVILYSAHLPFLAAAWTYKLFFRKVRVCLILPDLLEFMGTGGLRYRATKAVEGVIFRRLIRRVDCFVVLTKFAAERLGLEKGRYVVVEGIADTSAPSPHALDRPATEEVVFMYSGTLAGRYGIVDLLDAFESVKMPEARLWICGEGNSRDKVVAAAAKDPRITYFGQLPRHQVLELQNTADILVNPRTSSGEYTKYSFPSKTLEYLSSGKPAVLHRLPGIPEEYHPYFYCPEEESPAGMAAMMTRVAQLSGAERAATGARAQAFVREHKNPRAQCAKIVAMIDGVSMGSDTA